MKEIDPVGRAGEALNDAVDDAVDGVVDGVHDAVDDAVGGVVDNVEDAVGGALDGAAAAAVETVRGRPALLLAGLLLGGGLFLLAALFSGGVVQLLERVFLPVAFITDNSGDDLAWGQVLFTDPPQDYDPADFRGPIPGELLRRIDGAQESIDIAAFDFDLTPVAEALIAAQERGVAVRWFTDDEHGLADDGDAGGGQFALLQAAGIPVRDDAREPLMHNKFIVFDNETVWTGSTNLTENGLFRNNNNVIILEDRGIAEMYGREFDELWRGNSGGGSRSTFFRQRTTLDGTPVQIFFAPEDDAMDYLVPLAGKAAREIRFLAFSFTHDGLGEELVRAARRGVDVRGVFESRNANDEFTELHRLACNGLDVRLDGNPGSMHHKVFVIDDSIVVTGSFNFSNSANQSNDENMLFLNNTAVAPLYRAEFEKVWDEARPPAAGEVICR